MKLTTAIKKYTPAIRKTRKKNEQALEILRAGRKMIGTKTNWTTGAMFRNANDGAFTPTKSQLCDGAVCKVCSVGATSAAVLAHAAEKMGPFGVEIFRPKRMMQAEKVANSYLDKAAGTIEIPTWPGHFYQGIIPLNDQTDHKTVIKAWDLAIKMLEKDIAK